MSVGMRFNQLSTSHHSLISSLPYYIFSFLAVAVCIWRENKIHKLAVFFESLGTVFGHRVADTVRLLSYWLCFELTDLTWLCINSCLYFLKNITCSPVGGLERLPASPCQACSLAREAKVNSDVSLRPTFANNLVFDVAVHDDAITYNPL